MPMDVDTYRLLGLDQPAPSEVNGRSRADFLVSLNHAGDAPYHPCPEAHPDEGIARGTIAAHIDWAQSRIYPGTLRDIHVHVPAHVDRATPARLIVFNDGAYYFDAKGGVRAVSVLDSLHARGEIAPTVAVFVNPGRSRDDASKKRSEGAMAQRSLEYDTLTPTFGRFLIEDVLPFVEKSAGLTFSKDPAHCTLCGISSGGICAFTAAWHFPEQFGRVLSHCGSFVNIHGGHVYPYLVRATPRKPIRVFLQSGANDASYITGDWPLANQTMAKALAFAGYDYRFEFGTGGHSLRHGGAIFADSLRWLWREEKG
jgi:enterochelin esterase family protein